MDLFVGVSLTIVIATIIAGILQRLKQPIIIGHILTGLIVGPFLFSNPDFSNIIDSLSQFGIALLLFIIGLNLTPKVIKEVGKVSLLTGLGQILITSVAGFGVSKLLGFSNTVSLYLALALTFSSTIIIMKLISDKKDLSKVYSKISIGILLIQDLLVALILIAVSAFSGGNNDWHSVLFIILKGIILVDVIAIIAVYLVPLLSSSFARSQEFLFLFSIGWGLGLATLFHVLGFSMEIGALIAGVTLSISPYHFEISTRLRPLRDFFIILFFIMLGSRITFGNINQIIYPAIILSLFVIIIKPILVMFLTGSLGYRKKINFETAINFSQISEFSLVLLILTQRSGKIPGEVVSILVLVSLITIFISSYLILFSERLYPYFQRIVFQRKDPKNAISTKESYDVILFGCDRTGFDFIDAFSELKSSFLVVDFNPDVIKKLESLKIKCRYGDADDNEFLNELNLSNSKMIISTIPDFETNEFLLSKIRLENKEMVLMVISHDVDEALALYDAGASYVVMSHFLGGKYASMLISKFGFDMKKFVEEREKHLKDLERHKEVAKSLEG